MREARRSLEPAATLEQLLEASWAGRKRPIRGRELHVELVVTAAFLLAVAVLLATAPDADTQHGVVVGALVLAYALAARVEFPIGAASFTPTQLFLVPLFALAPAALVPALVFAAFVLAAAAAAVMRRGRSTASSSAPATPPTPWDRRSSSSSSRMATPPRRPPGSSRWRSRRSSWPTSCRRACTRRSSWAPGRTCT